MTAVVLDMNGNLVVSTPRATTGGSGHGGSGVESRLAKVEAAVQHIARTLIDTREDIREIRRIGFGVLGSIETEERTEPLVVDWDQLAATR